MNSPDTVVRLRHGRRRQEVKALDCGSSIRGFDSPRLPHLLIDCSRIPASWLSCRAHAVAESGEDTFGDTKWISSTL